MVETLSIKAKQAHEQIVGWIHNGKLRPGQKIPSERALAQEMGMSHLTVRRGLDILVSEGIIVKQPRVGNFVCDVKSPQTATQIAMILPEFVSKSDARHPSLELHLKGAQRAFNPREYMVSMLSYRPGHLWLDAGEVAVERGVKGILLLPGPDVAREDVQRLIDAGIQVVMLASEPHLAGLGLVQTGLDTGMALAQILDRLVDLGHKKIVVVQYKETPFKAEHANIVETICRKAHLAPLNEIVFELYNHGWVDYGPLVNVFDRKPTAVVVPDEFVASEFFRLCYKRGIRIPEDISMAAVMDLTPQAHPIPLTAPDSRQLFTQANQLAGEYLIQILSGNVPPEREIRLRYDVIWKESISSPRAD
jgi:DNA-binding LacI/PurR family transcriptional regulator